MDGTSKQLPRVEYSSLSSSTTNVEFDDELSSTKRPKDKIESLQTKSNHIFTHLQTRCAEINIKLFIVKSAETTTKMCMPKRLVDKSTENL